MDNEGRSENRAAEDFMEYGVAQLEEEKRQFVNMREMLLDVIIHLEKEQEDLKFTKRVKKRILEARSSTELRLIMDGLLVLTGFTLRQGVV